METAIFPGPSFHVPHISPWSSEDAKMKLSQILLMAAPIALVGIGTTAQAKESDKSVIVKFDDLSLSTPSGRERLMTRVRMAARDVCGVRNAQGLRQRTIVRRCEAVAMRNADVALAGLFNGNGGRLADRGHLLVAAP